MNRLSGYLFRAAGLSVLVAVGIIFAVSMIGDWWNFHHFEASLPPHLLAELRGEGQISMELSNALNAFYTSWPVRAVLPVAVLLGTVAGGLVGMIHSSRLLRPLDAVDTALARLAQGDTTARARARPSKIAEIDSFQSNFNTMAAAVERAERELRESNAAIAHELRTPLTVLIGRLNGMLDGIFPMDEASIRGLLTQTDQLHRIIEDLSLLTLADAGRFRLDRQNLDFAELVRGALAAEPGDIETNLQPVPLNADPARLRQVLAALLNNARRYAVRPDGTAASGLRVETVIEDEYAVLRLLDRGPGLSPEQATRAFDRFWRADTSRAKESGGSGLGLAVVRSLAEAHGGYVHYDDRPGGGSIFTVSIPMNDKGIV